MQQRSRYFHDGSAADLPSVVDHPRPSVRTGTDHGSEGGPRRVPQVAL